MAKYEFHIYSPDSLAYNYATRSFELDSGFTQADRNLVEVSDNDKIFDGDRTSNERGDDKDQNATVKDGDGTQIVKGNVYVEEVAVVRAPDGSEIELHRIEVDGTHVGYTTSEPLKPGESYEYIRSYNVGENIGGSDTRLTYDFYESNSVTCFGPGTLILTDDGEIPVEWLEVGDKVLTRDHGYQPILWLARTTLPARHFDTYPSDQPVTLAQGTLGNGLPTRDLVVTGDHRLLICDPLAQLMFDSCEVLAPAKAWADADLASVVPLSGDITLTHILFRQHEVITAHGAWVESFFPGPEALRRLSPRHRAEIAYILGVQRVTPRF